LTEVSQLRHLLSRELTLCLTEVSQVLLLLACQLTSGLTEVTILSTALKHAREVCAGNATDRTSQLRLTCEVCLRSSESLSVALVGELGLLIQDSFLSVAQGTATEFTHAARTELTRLDKRVRNSWQQVLAEVTQ
jgi:hypothetical protein